MGSCASKLRPLLKAMRLVSQSEPSAQRSRNQRISRVIKAGGSEFSMFGGRIKQKSAPAPTQEFASGGQWTELKSPEGIDSDDHNGNGSGNGLSQRDWNRERWSDRAESTLTPVGSKDDAGIALTVDYSVESHRASQAQARPPAAVTAVPQPLVLDGPARWKQARYAGAGESADRIAPLRTRSSSTVRSATSMRVS